MADYFGLMFCSNTSIALERPLFFLQANIDLIKIVIVVLSHYNAGGRLRCSANEAGSFKERLLYATTQYSVCAARLPCLTFWSFIS